MYDIKGGELCGPKFEGNPTVIYGIVDITVVLNEVLWAIVTFP
jgi:hypothetical protein